MTRYPTCVLIFMILALASPATAAEEEDSPLPVNGSLGVVGMYDSNFTLSADRTDERRRRDDFILGIDAKIGANYSWARLWRLEADLQGLANWPYYHSENPWYVGNANLYAGLAWGANTISLLDSPRYFSTPDILWSDFIRNAATLAYKRAFFRLLEGRIGYENIAAVHPDDRQLDYFMNGGFIELRNTWTPLVSTYYTVDYLAYVGGDKERDVPWPRAPEKGRRLTVEAGVDAFFTRRHCLKSAYIYQVDDSDFDRLDIASAPAPTPTPSPPPPAPGSRTTPSPPPTHQASPNEFGRFTGDQGSLEIDAEFGYIKHKAEFFYSVRLSDRFTLSLYDEYVYKAFSDEMSPTPDPIARVDRLFLTSAWLTVRLKYGLFTKARYIYRLNDPLNSASGFEDHIGSLSFEYHF